MLVNNVFFFFFFLNCWVSEYPLLSWWLLSNYIAQPPRQGYLLSDRCVVAYNKVSDIDTEYNNNICRASHARRKVLTEVAMAFHVYQTTWIQLTPGLAKGRYLLDDHDLKKKNLALIKSWI